MVFGINREKTGVYWFEKQLQLQLNYCAAIDDVLVLSTINTTFTIINNSHLR